MNTRICRIFAFAVFVLFTAPMFSQVLSPQEKRKSLNDIVMQVKNTTQLPMELADGLWFQSFSTDGTDLIYTYKATNPTMKSIFQKQENLKEQLKMSVASLKQMGSFITDNKVGIKMKVIDENGKTLASSRLSSSEIMNSKEVGVEEYVQQTVANARKSLPIDLGNGITLVDVTAKGNFLVYKLECSNIYQFVDIQESTLKQNIITSFAPSMRSSLAKRGIGLVYEYYNSGKKIYSASISPQELQENADIPLEHHSSESMTVEDLVKEIKEQTKFPMKISEGFYFWDVLQDNNSFVYLYKVSDPSIKENIKSEGMRQQELQSLKEEPVMKNILEFFPIILRYIDEDGKKIAEGVYTKESVK